MKSKTWVATGAALALGAAAFVWFLMRSHEAPYREDPELTSSLHEITDDYRKIIVLVDGAGALDEAARSHSIAAGRTLFEQKQDQKDGAIGSREVTARSIGHSSGSSNSWWRDQNNPAT